MIPLLLDTKPKFIQNDYTFFNLTGVFESHVQNLRFKTKDCSIVKEVYLILSQWY